MCESPRCRNAAPRSRRRAKSCPGVTSAGVARRRSPPAGVCCGIGGGKRLRSEDAEQHYLSNVRSRTRSGCTAPKWRRCAQRGSHRRGTGRTDSKPAPARCGAESVPAAAPKFTGMTQRSPHRDGCAALGEQQGVSAPAGWGAEAPSAILCIGKHTSAHSQVTLRRAVVEEQGDEAALPNGP